MGLVKVSEQMHENLRVASGALSRSINSQAHNRSFGNGSEKHNPAAAGYNGRSQTQQDKSNDYRQLTS